MLNGWTMWNSSAAYQKFCTNKKPELSKRADKIHKTNCRKFPQSRKPNHLNKLPLLLLGAKVVPESRGRVKVQRPLCALHLFDFELSSAACLQGGLGRRGSHAEALQLCGRKRKIHRERFLILKMPTALVPCSILLS